MTDPKAMLETTCYLTLTPTFRRNGSDLTAVKMVVGKVTKTRPTGREPVVKLRLRLPARAFAPLAPEVTIEVSEDALSWPEPEVTVVADPESGAS